MTALMRSACVAGLIALTGVGAAGQQPAPAPTTPTRVMRSYQIDRYEAIEMVRRELKSNPNNLTDWVLLGELAQEVAVDAPADRAGSYYRLSREAYDNALKLQPNNATFRAAAQFAREQERGANTFNQARSQSTAAYLTARRQELIQAGNAPMLRVYGSTPPAQGTAPAATYPAYQPYVNGQGQAYTYRQHYDSIFGPVQSRSPGQAVTATERGALVKPAAAAAPP